MALRNTLLQATLESVAEDATPVVTDSEYQEQNDGLCAANAGANDVLVQLANAQTQAFGLEALLVSLEQHAQDGLDHLSGKFLHHAYATIGADLGFESIHIPASDTFARNGKMATTLSMEAIEGRLGQVIEAIKHMLKQFIAHLKVFWRRLMDSSKTLEQRAKALRKELSSYDDEMDHYNIHLESDEAFFVRKEGETSSIQPLGNALELAGQIRHYEQMVAGTGADTLYHILDLLKKESDTTSLTKKVESLSKNALPTPSHITKFTDNSYGGKDGESMVYGGGYKFFYSTKQLPHLKDLLTIASVELQRDPFFQDFQPWEHGVPTLSKSDIVKTIDMLLELAKEMKFAGETFARTESLVERTTSQLHLQRPDSNVDEVVIREIVMYLKSVITKQQAMIQAVNFYLNRVGGAYLKYAAKSLASHRIKV